MPKVIEENKLGCPYCKKIQIIERPIGHGTCNECFNTYKIGITVKGFISLIKKTSSEKHVNNKKLLNHRINSMNTFIKYYGKTEKNCIKFGRTIGLNRNQLFVWMTNNNFKINYRKVNKIYNEI